MYFYESTLDILQISYFIEELILWKGYFLRYNRAHPPKLLPISKTEKLLQLNMELMEKVKSLELKLSTQNGTENTPLVEKNEMEKEKILLIEPIKPIEEKNIPIEKEVKKYDIIFPIYKKR